MTGVFNFKPSFDENCSILQGVSRLTLRFAGGDIPGEFLLASASTPAQVTYQAGL